MTVTVLIANRNTVRLQTGTDHVCHHRLREAVLLLQFHLQLPQRRLASAHTHTHTCTSMHTTSKLSQTKKTNITSAATTSVILMTIYQVNFTWLSQLSLTCSRAEPTRDNWCRISTEHMVFLPPNHQHRST